MIKPGTNKKRQLQINGKQLASVFGFLVVLFIILTSVTAPKSTSPKSVSTTDTSSRTTAPTTKKTVTTSTAAKTTTTTPAVTTKSTPAAKAPTPTPTTNTLLTQSGSGQASTASFTTNDNWQIQYTFDYTNFGSEGKFQIYINNTINGSLNDDTGANDLSVSGGNTDHYYDAGSHYLQVNSECDWTITVTDTTD